MCSSLSYLLMTHQTVFIEGTHFTNISQILNTELENVNIWLKANQLTVNIKKTHNMMSPRTRIKLNTNFKILFNNNIQIQIQIILNF